MNNLGKGKEVGIIGFIVVIVVLIIVGMMIINTNEKQKSSISE